MWEGVDMGKLTVLSARALREPGRYGDGLYLHISPSGTKSWVQRIVINDKRRDIALGSYPSVGVAQARILAADNRAAVAEGRDPLAENREAKDAARNPTPSVPTFAEAAAAVIDLRRPTWSNPKHAAQWESTMATYVYPIIGDMAVDEISAVDVLEVLESIWTTKPETATRVRQRMETVMDWVMNSGYLHYPRRDGACTRPSPRSTGCRTTMKPSRIAGYRGAGTGARVDSQPPDQAGLRVHGVDGGASRRGAGCKLDRDSLGNPRQADEGQAVPQGAYVGQGDGDPHGSLSDDRSGRAYIPCREPVEANV